MCTIIRHISSYIRSVLILAIMVLNLGAHKVCAELEIDDINNPEKPYKINKAEDLVNAFNLMNEWIDFWSFDQHVFSISLESDIDMEGVDFTSTQGYSLPVFFEGNNHTIKNLKFTGFDEGVNSGLFPSLYNGSIVRNINFENIDVILPGRISGVIAGIINDNVEISNLNISGKVVFSSSAPKYIGGVIGNMSSGSNIIFRDITVDLEYDVKNEVSAFGGIVGCIDGASSTYYNLVNRSKNTVSIYNSTSGVGGIVGFIQKPEKYKFHDCSNYMGIESGSPYVGGIVGFSGKPTRYSNVMELYNCTNAGNVYSQFGHCGGIAGSTIQVKISNCVNIGSVTAYEPSANDDIQGVGGIVGSYNVQSLIMESNTLSSCVNMGYISSYNNVNTAGIVGYYYCTVKEYNGLEYSDSKIFPFQNCLSISEDASNRIVDNFEFNTSPGGNILGGLYSDSSYGQPESNDSVHNLSNSTLISGHVPFFYYTNTSNWLDNESALAMSIEPAFLQKPGYYPYLPLNDDIAKLASLPIIVADGERLDSIASGFSCGMVEGVEWRSKNGLFEVSDDGFATILGPGDDVIYGILGDAVISRKIRVYKNVFGGGRGKVDNPYILRNIAHLEELRDSLATAPGWSKNKYFKLAGDITGLDFALSPSRDTRFMGSLDGGGYTIQMKINNSDVDAALFVVAEDATIHDLQTSGFVSGKDLAAGVCVAAYNCNIYNCFNSARISAAIAGGVIAYSEGGNLYGLCNSGTITASNIAGGVIGNANDINDDIRISDLFNTGYVNGPTAAGLIGDAEKISASYDFKRLINYGSVCGSTQAYPYIYSTTFSGYSYSDCHYDIQIVRNGKCVTSGFTGGRAGLDFIPTTATDVAYDLFSADLNPVYIPSFVMDMRNAELLGIIPSFENDELTSFVQTSPSLLTEGLLSLRKIDSSEEYTKLSDLVSYTDVTAILTQKSEFDDIRETYITIAAIPFRSGEGTADDPYLINDLNDLKSLSALIKANKVTEEYYVTSKKNNWSYNKHFKLTSDILGDGTASTIVTEPIASLATPFQGVFDGDGHTIKVTINNMNQNYQALFASIETGAVIENLIVTGVVNGKMCVSGVVASATALNEGDEPVIRNVINNVSVTSSSDCIGGICGISSARIEDCANTGNISISIDSDPFYIGGVAGSTSSNIIRCVNIGNVYGHRRIGGICGNAKSEKDKGLIKDCINYGMVTSQCSPSVEFACIGGIAGSVVNFDIETSLNLNRVICRNKIDADAIVGNISGEVNDCYYDKQVSEFSSKFGEGLLTSEFSKLSVDAFKNNAGMYPTLSSPLSGEALPKLASSPLILFENHDNGAFDVVSKIMNYGDVKVANSDIKWTGKNGVMDVIKTENGYTIKPTAVGSDTLTATYGIYSKQIKVDVYCIPVQVDTLISACQEVSVRKSDGTEVVCYNDTVFTEVYKRDNSNCDSTIKYTVKIKKLTEYLIDTVLCAKSSVTGAVYRGNNYTNTEYITLNETVGCDSVITTNLRVVIPRTDSVYTNSGCDSVFCEIDGKYYSKSVTFYDTIRSKKCNCDSVIVNVKLNVTNSDAYEFDEVYLDSFRINGKKLTGGQTLTLYDTLVTSKGCDSIVKRNIYVYDRVFKMDTVIYACDFYLDNVNFKRITRDTVLVEQLSETLHGIKVEGYYLQKRDIRISHNTSADTTKIPDEYYCERYRLTENVGGIENVIGYITRDTVVLTKIPRDKKCDSVLVRTIHILPAPVRDTVEFVNCGDFYDESLDTTFTSTQDYLVRKKFNNSHCDCDSSIQLRRYSIRTTKYNNINISGCSEAQYTFYGNVEPTTFTSSVDTVDVIRYTSGPVCDSIVNNVHIAVANPIYDTIRKSTCGDTIMYAGKVYLASDGDYKETITYRSAAGCDSLIRFLDFRFVETIENVLPTRYGCDSVVCDINKMTYYEDHIISVEVGTTEQGCPIFNTQHVVVLHPTSTNVEVMGCEFAEFNGDIFYNDTTLQLHLKSRLCDCDSFVNVKILVLPRIESPTIYISECDSVIINDPENGEVVIKEDVDDYQCMYQKVYNVAGKEYICDSIVHYNVHVKQPTYNSIVYTGESSVVYGGTTYRRSQVIRDTLVNAEGCDSFVEIKIVVEKDLGYPVIVDKFGYTLFCNNNIGKVKFATYQWYKNGVAIPGATKEYYEGAKGEKLNGCYYVEVTSTTGREYVSETYCVDKGRELKIYPNPVAPDNILTIDYPFTEDEKKNLRVEIYDAMGIMVGNFVPTMYPIQLEVNLPVGHYFVLIYESDERMLDTRFIVR